MQWRLSKAAKLFSCEHLTFSLSHRNLQEKQSKTKHKQTKPKENKTTTTKTTKRGELISADGC